CLEVTFVNLPELLQATRDAVLLEAADRATELDIGIDQLRQAVPIASQERVVGVAHDLNVLLRHRCSIPEAQASRAVAPETDDDHVHASKGRLTPQCPKIYSFGTTDGTRLTGARS